MGKHPIATCTCKPDHSENIDFKIETYWNHRFVANAQFYGNYIAINPSHKYFEAEKLGFEKEFLLMVLAHETIHIALHIIGVEPDKYYEYPLDKYTYGKDESNYRLAILLGIL